MLEGCSQAAQRVWMKGRTAPCQQPQQYGWLTDPSLVFPQNPPALQQPRGEAVPLCQPSAPRQGTGRSVWAAGALAQPGEGTGLQR